MKEKFKTKFIASKRGTEVEFFGKNEGLGKVEGESLSDDLEQACNQLIKDGYTIENIIPISSGDVISGRNSIAYSYTSGLMITALLIS